MHAWFSNVSYHTDTWYIDVKFTSVWHIWHAPANSTKGHTDFICAWWQTPDLASETSASVTDVRTSVTVNPNNSVSSGSSLYPLLPFCGLRNLNLHPLLCHHLVCLSQYWGFCGLWSSESWGSEVRRVESSESWVGLSWELGWVELRCWVELSN